MKKNLVIGFYSHPEYYPPVLNALEYLSRVYDNIDLVHRNYPSFQWTYPANVELVSNGTARPIKDIENDHITKKVWLFFRFTCTFYRRVQKTKPDTILLYDTIALLAYFLVRPFIRKPAVLWYHNHDVADTSLIKKYSISWWAWKAEKVIFPRLTIFTLPALERKTCFPMNTLKGQFFFVPNFPSIRVYAPYQQIEKDNKCIRLLYQGSIGRLHGLEEIIPLLSNKVMGRQLELVLKGFISNEYLSELRALAEQHGVSDKLLYKGSGSYREVMENAAACHIGIGIHKKSDIMNKTLGTASNKIYEYAASGMPVLLYDNTHFRTHLGQFEWAFFTDCSTASLLHCIEEIALNYATLSKRAKADFVSFCNFEHVFAPVFRSLENLPVI